MKKREIEMNSNDDLFNLIYQIQKELLRRGIHTKFEDLRLTK